MTSTYYILDLTSDLSELDSTLKGIVRQYTQDGGLFMPIFNTDKTKILIQVKGRFRLPRALTQAIIASGDVSWASNLGLRAEWQQDQTSDLFDKTMNYFREQTTIDTFVQDVKTAPVQTIPPDKLPADGR